MGPGIETWGFLFTQQETCCSPRELENPLSVELALVSSFQLHMQELLAFRSVYLPQCCQFATGERLPDVQQIGINQKNTYISMD